MGGGVWKGPLGGERGAREVFKCWVMNDQLLILFKHPSLVVVLVLLF